jgi:hypothetical protein
MVIQKSMSKKKFGEHVKMLNHHLNLFCTRDVSHAKETIVLYIRQINFLDNLFYSLRSKLQVTLNFLVHIFGMYIFRHMLYLNT